MNGLCFHESKNIRLLSVMQKNTLSRAACCHASELPSLSTSNFQLRNPSSDVLSITEPKVFVDFLAWISIEVQLCSQWSLLLDTRTLNIFSMNLIKSTEDFERKEPSEVSNYGSRRKEKINQFVLSGEASKKFDISNAIGFASAWKLCFLWFFAQKKYWNCNANTWNFLKQIILLYISLFCEPRLLLDLVWDLLRLRMNQYDLTKTQRDSRFSNANEFQELSQETCDLQSLWFLPETTNLYHQYGTTKKREFIKNQFWNIDLFVTKFWRFRRGLLLTSSSYNWNKRDP